jgi:hypothetical protein
MGSSKLVIFQLASVINTHQKELMNPIVHVLGVSTLKHLAQYCARQLWCECSVWVNQKPFFGYFSPFTLEF